MNQNVSNPIMPITIDPADAAWLIVFVQASVPAEDSGPMAWDESGRERALHLLQYGSAVEDPPEDMRQYAPDLT